MQISKFFSFFPLLLIAVLLQVIGVNEIIVLLAPVITWIATYIVNLIKAKLGDEGFSGTVLITMIVPLAGLLATWITSLIEPGLNFFYTFLLSFGAVFINQFLKQWGQTAKGIQNAVEPTITTVKK